MKDSTYKLLLLSYCCEPGRGSEWGLGWSYVQEFSRTQPVWLLTHADNRAGLEKYLAEKHTGHPVHVTYVKLPRFLGWMRDSWYSLFNFHYYLWQFAARRAAIRLHEQEKLDLVQHVSLCRWWMPSAGAALANRGVGFIFGPVGGGEILPRKFREGSPVISKFADAMRWVGRTICRHDPLLQYCIRRADLILAAIPAAETWLRQYGNPNIELISPATCSSVEVLAAAQAARDARPSGKPFTFMSCGGLSYFRGVDLSLRAFAKAALPDARYVHVCDGPMRPMLEKLARDLGIADRVTFAGDLPHVECVKLVAQADAVVHMVLRDSEGVLPDVMHVGVPAITMDHLTPAMLVTDASGQLIKVDDATLPSAVIAQLAGVMQAWYADPALVARKGAAAAERGKLFEPAARGDAYRSHHYRVLRDMRAKQPLADVPLVPARAAGK